MIRDPLTGRTRLQPMAPVRMATVASQMLNQSLPQRLQTPMQRVYDEQIKAQLQKTFPEVEVDRVKNIRVTDYGVQFDYEDGTGYWWE